MLTTLLDDTRAQKDDGPHGAIDQLSCKARSALITGEIDSMISHILPLKKIIEAFDLMHAGKSIRAVVVY